MIKGERVDKNPNYFYNETIFSTLENAQSKMVILTRFDNSYEQNEITEYLDYHMSMKDIGGCVYHPKDGIQCYLQ